MRNALQTRDLLLHGARLALAVAVLLTGAKHPAIALLGGVMLHLAAFAFAHDVLHGALGLPRRLNEVVLTLAALPMLVAGHDMRRMHLHHHARPLTADDLEGVGATVSLPRALWLGPMNAAQYRVRAFVEADAFERRWLVLETIANALLALVALASRSVVGAAWVTANVMLQLTASAWASHLPHRPCSWMVWMATRLAWTRSAVVMSFLHHGAHHERPGVPCAQLG